jgi:hypothetical protein
MQREVDLELENLLQYTNGNKFSKGGIGKHDCRQFINEIAAEDASHLRSDDASASPSPARDSLVAKTKAINTIPNKNRDLDEKASKTSNCHCGDMTVSSSSVVPTDSTRTSSSLLSKLGIGLRSKRKES